MTAARVVVVDDQEQPRTAIAAVVSETDGFELVAAVASGEESLVTVSRLRPDLVLMDVNLPGIDGIEATRRITRGTDPPVVILLSTYDQDEVEVAGCGAAAYIAKASFGPALLAAVWDDANDPDRATPPPVRQQRSEC